MAQGAWSQRGRSWSVSLLLFAPLGLRALLPSVFTTGSREARGGAGPGRVIPLLCLAGTQGERSQGLQGQPHVSHYGRYYGEGVGLTVIFLCLALCPACRCVHTYSHACVSVCVCVCVCECVHARRNPASVPRQLASYKRAPPQDASRRLAPLPLPAPRAPPSLPSPWLEAHSEAAAWVWRLCSGSRDGG